MTPEQEEAVLNKCIALIERFAGQRPTGHVAPWWELSAATVALLLKNGITYDHSRMDNDFHPSTRGSATPGRRSIIRSRPRRG